MLTWLILSEFVVLSSAYNVARSGLAAETLRMQTAATNIANLSSTDYVPKRVEQTTRGETGGVQAVVQPITKTDPGAPAPTVDLIREVTTLAQAEAAYKANLAVIATVDEMTESLLDIIGDDRRD